MKIRFASLVAVALSAFAARASAQGVDEFGAYGGLDDRHRSATLPQRLAVEVRFGPYSPRVDEAVEGTPYEDTFGDDTRWSGGVEVDWQALRLDKILSLGPGFGFGYTHIGAKAILPDGGRAEQETSLMIIPMHLAAVLRVDALADNTPVPIVPYAKAGFGFAFWDAGEGDDSAKDDASYGYMWAAGAMLRLDWLEPDAANTARATSGLDHSYIFGEWYSSKLDGFGSGSDVMDVGNQNWVVGLAVETLF